MKIAVVIPKYGLVGGAEAFAYELTERLAQRDEFEIHVFANKWRQGRSTVTFHKVPHLPFPRFMRPINFAYFSKRRIHPEYYDLIHSHDRIFTMNIFTMHGIPHKTWIREARAKPLSLFDRSMAWVEEKALKGSSLPMILPVSTLVKEELLRIYDIPESKIQVIHPGVSIDRFKALDHESCRYEIRQRHGLSQSDIIVLFVGMNFEIKRLQLVLKGIAHLVGTEMTNSTLKLLVVGKGDERRYLAMARGLGIQNRILFAGVSREIEKYYLASDIFTMPSQLDTFGLAVLEAMTAGLPVIITQKVGASDLIDPDIHGFVLGKDPSPLDFSEKLAFLMKKENRMRLGDNARKAALQYTWDKVGDQVADLYHKLVRRGNPV
ncbi:MAG: glycosyltransferase family 4 protein [Deltaproteobacteria bacterium]|nr:glycosyltransferase family 4 protein [Deltaproteobacteria bacterium]MBW2338971.1 glycosyltransferase family 4 protein [Deltaproteobacteria bacterium]